MPNIIVEYADPVAERVNVGGLVEDLHRAALNTGLFSPDAVKTRAYPCHTWLIGERENHSTFVHVEAGILAGRSAEQKKQLSEALLAVLVAHCPAVFSMTVDIRDMDTQAFSKHTNDL